MASIRTAPMPSLLVSLLFSVSFVATVAAFPRAMFTFGDDVLDVGNLQYLPGRSFALPASYRAPYGQLYKPHSGRSTDGKTMADRVADYLGIASPPPFLQPRAVFTSGASFAVNGACAVQYSASFYAAAKGTETLNLASQINNFEKLIQAHPAMKAQVSSAFFLVSIGTEDIVTYIKHQYFTGKSDQALILPAVNDPFTIALVQGIAAGVKRLTSLGARRIGFLTINQLGCTPVFRSLLQQNQGCISWMTLFIDQVNKLVQTALGSYLHNHQLVILDPNPRIVRPVSGFQLDPCCGGPPPQKVQYACGSPGSSVCTNPSQHIYWDSRHTSQAFNFAFLTLAWNGSNCYPVALKAFLQS